MFRLCWILFVFLGALTTLPSKVGAHNAPGSAIVLDFHTEAIAAELTLPLSELEISFGKPLLATPEASLAANRSLLAHYIEKHLQFVSPDAKPWVMEIGSLQIEGEPQASDVMIKPKPSWLQLAEGVPVSMDLVVKAVFRPPSGAPMRQFTIHSDLISHEVKNHFALVSVRSDWNHAQVKAQPALIGTLRSFSTELPVVRDHGSFWTGFRGLLFLGSRHIADGTDHLLFLLTLLLPALFRAEGRRWAGVQKPRRVVSHLGVIVTAFTLAHSATLLLAATHLIHLPSEPVEALIAASILVSAVHSFRPIFPQREAYIAAGFGLVHGLAFAEALEGMHLDGLQLTSALLAFNLGIELMQMIVVALTIPWLIVISRSRFASLARGLGALGSGIAALGWLLERSLGWENPLASSLTFLTAHVWECYIGLVIVALLCLWSRRRSPPAATRDTASSASSS